VTRRPGRIAAIALVAAIAVTPSIASDPAEAKRQYRLARRLAAEGSPDAAAALRRVAELDPRGPLADDARVEEALLLPLARWPEQLGQLDAGQARAALDLLDRAIDETPGGDRIALARHCRALIRLEPLPGFDPRGAREDLDAVVTAREAAAEAEADASRYTLAWLNAREGRAERASSTLHRIVIDSPASEAALRARVEIARLQLRLGDPGSAARWLEEAIDGGVGAESRAVPLRELAMRRVLSRSAAGKTPVGSPFKVLTGLRAISDIVPTLDGSVFMASRRERSVVRLGPRGRSEGEWRLAGLRAVAVDARGRAFAAADGSIWRLAAGGKLSRVATAGDYAPVQSLTIDELGGMWLLDRRGQRVGRLEPGGVEPVPYWEDRSFRLTDLVWDGGRLIGLDGGNRRIVAFGADRLPRTLPVAQQLLRPLALAVDPAGRIAILDPKAGVVLFAHEGVAEVFALSAAGVERPVAIGLGYDGALHLFDEEGGGWFTQR
jgi:hypothetical protein